MRYSFPYCHQLDAMDCGPTCLHMIAKYYGKNYSLQTLRARSFISRNGVSMLGISDAAESIGFRTSGVRISFEQLVEDVPLPCILHWNQNHFVVCYDIKKKKGQYWFKIADPASQLVTYNEQELKRCWLATKSDGEEKGTALALEPTPNFYAGDDEQELKTKGLHFFLCYLTPYKKQLVQLVLGMLLMSMLQLILPFLTQALVDVGIRDGNLGFITLVLVAQIIITVSQLSVEFIRSWILLREHAHFHFAHLGLLDKVDETPASLFRHEDGGGHHTANRRPQSYKNVSNGNFHQYALLFCQFLYLCHCSCLLQREGVGDLSVWKQSVYSLDTGFHEVSPRVGHTPFCTGCRRAEQLGADGDCHAGDKAEQLRDTETMAVGTHSGEAFQNQCKGIGTGAGTASRFCVFQSDHVHYNLVYCRKGGGGRGMTLGMMMSLTYIIGQLSAPVSSFIGFVQQFQDAKISLERLNEVHGKPDEEQDIASKLSVLPERRDIKMENVCFSYDGADRDYVLDNVSLVIPEHKVTAIVGASGSGKTTLVKLMLGFYSPNKGSVKIGDASLENINPHLWRAKTGAVMQDGFIFSETIAQNIAVGEEQIDVERLRHAVTVANIRDFIDSLPLGYNTKIGMEGNGISQGQKQRLLIARAVYKNPEFLFFDEATNALDANNEKEIMEHLHEFYKGKTVVVVAHRLSTVKDADKIVVLDKGCIAEEGTHRELTERKGLYYLLVKNQLELGG